MLHLKNLIQLMSLRRNIPNTFISNVQFMEIHIFLSQKKVDNCFTLLMWQIIRLEVTLIYAMLNTQLDPRQERN